jgi:hypothetical protein
MGYIGSDPKNNESVSTSQLVDDSVTNAKIVDNVLFTSVTSSIVSASGNITADTFTGTFNGALSSSVQIATSISGSSTSLSSSLSTRATTLESASGSFASDLVTLKGSGTAQGVGTSDSPTFADATITGTLTAQEIHTEFESASVIFTSGSTKFGDTIDDTHQVTGSLLMTGSMAIGTGRGITPNGIFDVGLNTDGTRRFSVSFEDSLVSLSAKNQSNNGEVLKLMGDGLRIHIGTNTSGTEKMRIDSSGNVGIGTNNPGNPLHLHSDTYPQLSIDGTDNSGNIGFVLSGSGGRGGFRWNGSNNDVEILREGGAVEISLLDGGGTTFAGGATINGDTLVGRTGNQKGKLTLQSRTGAATRKTNAIVAVPYNDTSESICMIGMDGQSSQNEMHIGSNTSDFMSPTFIDFFVATSVTSQTNNRKMRINNDGVTVGGTASPQRSLHVQGTGIVLSEGDRDRASLLSTYSDANDGAMIFNTRSGGASRERMRLTSTGNLCVGPSGSSAGFYPALTVTGTQPCMGLRGQDGNSGYFFNQLLSPGSNKITLFYSHEINYATATNDGGTSENSRFTLDTSGNVSIDGNLTEGSDIRLKTNIEKIPDVLDVLDEIKPVKFEWKEDVKEGIEKKHIGLIAQEVEPHFPELIYEGTTRDTDDETYKGLNYAGLTPILLKSIQELSSKVNELQQKIEELEK